MINRREILRIEFEKNRETFRKFFNEVESYGELHLIDDIFAINVTLHSPFPGLPSGVEGLRQGIVILRNAFPDFSVVEEDMISEKDKIVARCIVSGTHKGDFLGISPSGKNFKTTEIMIARFENRQIVELWSVVDEISQRKQLGWL